MGGWTAAVSALAAAASVLLVAAGYLLNAIFHRRKRKRDVLEERFKKYDQNVEVTQQLFYAVCGRPKDEYNERIPGLLEQVKRLSDQVGAVTGQLRRYDDRHPPAGSPTVGT